MNFERVFVSGGAGVIGKALVDLLLQAHVQVFVGDLKPCPQEWIGKVHYRQGDLNTLTADELLSFNPDCFFHLAATFERSEETYPFFEENWHHNVKLSHHLVTCLKQSKRLKKVVFASSYLIYDPSLYQFSTPQEFPVSLTEDSPIYPRNICGAAKLFHEMELRFLDHFFKGQISFTSARIFRVYGRNSRDVISRWIRSALQNEKILVYRPEGRFDYIFADDVAKGLLLLSQQNNDGIVNLGTGRARSVQDVLNILNTHFPDLKIEQKESTIPFENSQAGMEHFKSLTGWQPDCQLEEGIGKLIEFEKGKKNHHLPPMPTYGVLITSISKKVPLIRAVKQAAYKIGQFTTIHGCDCNISCLGRYEVDKFWHCPSLDALTIEEVVQYCLHYHIKAIIPTRDADLLFYAKHSDVLKKHHIHVMTSNLETIQLCSDKLLFSQTLKHHTLPVIPSSISAEFETFSFVVKEQYGAGSSSILLNVSKLDAIKLSRQLAHPIFQPYIEGREWSIDLYRSFKGQVKGCVARLRDKVVNGESQITTTRSYPRLEQLCEKASHLLNIKGHAVFQVIEDSLGNFHIIECNPRFGGASTASLAVGLDSFYWFFLECLGQDLEQYQFNRLPHEIRQLRYPTDKVIVWS